MRNSEVENKTYMEQALAINLAGGYSVVKNEPDGLEKV
jgi:hypothetical protein